MESHSDYAPIERYLVVGDCRSAALVSDRGSIDWLCLPRFDSAPWFSALLDARRGGRFAIRPASVFELSRRYVGDTNVLMTAFRTGEGAAELIDDMPVASEEEKRREPWPERLIQRAVRCTAGEVDLEVVYDPRPDFGRSMPRIRDHGKLGFCCEAGPHLAALRSEIPLRAAQDRPGLYGRIRLHAGETRWVTLAVSGTDPAPIPPLGDAAARRLVTSLRWWREWSARCRYQGPYRDAVIRSALALKLMAYAPSGAIVAAPTTSLPEAIGHDRNWDYRYCWLRDASLTLRSLYELGYETEGHAFMEWMIDATRETWPELQVLYDVHGEPSLRERQIVELEGYAGSRPVRIGNAAARLPLRARIRRHPFDRRRVRDLQLLVRGVPRAGRRRRGSVGRFRAPAPLGERRRAVRRGNGSRHGGRARELSASLHARRPDPHGADAPAGPPRRGRGAVGTGAGSPRTRDRRNGLRGAEGIVNLPDVLLWGFVATLILSALLAAAQWVGLSRMSLPFLLGTVFTPDRDRAMWIGFLVHLLNGWIIALVYALLFESLRRVSWGLGTAFGVIHGIIVLTVLMPLLPSFHPRMASETRGPTPTRQLQPAGFLGLHYGRRLPVAILVAHAIYGAILGGCYRLHG